MSSTDDRRFEILRAIVTDFVATHEPIASKALVDRHNLGVSSATVRNDMAVLEAEGLIIQPHTSSGRVSTDKGYRLFVDRIHDVKPLSKPERRAILSFLDHADKLIKRPPEPIPIWSVRKRIAVAGHGTQPENKGIAGELLFVNCPERTCHERPDRLDRLRAG